MTCSVYSCNERTVGDNDMCPYHDVISAAYNLDLLDGRFERLVKAEVPIMVLLAQSVRPYKMAQQLEGGMNYTGIIRVLKRYLKSK